MKNFNLSKFAQKQSQNIEINGNVITAYHRTDRNDIVGNICTSGFIAGGGAAWGKGIYANYSLKSAMQNYGLQTYGGIVIKGLVNLQGFLIFDYNIAKKVCGANYDLVSQIDNLMGMDQFCPNENYKQTVIELSKALHSSGGKTSDKFRYLFHMAPSNFPNKLRGIVFTGHADGNVVLSYDVSAIYPTAYCFLDEKVKSEYEWNDCVNVDLESYKELNSVAVNYPKEVSAEKTLLTQELSRNSFSARNYKFLPDKFIKNTLISHMIRLNSEQRNDFIKNNNINISKDEIDTVAYEKELYANPVKFWNDYYPNLPSLINKDIALNALQSHLDAYPSLWGTVNEETHQLLDTSGLENYYRSVLTKSPELIKVVPNIAQGKLKEQFNINIDDSVDLRRSIDENIMVPFSSEKWFRQKVESLNRKALKLGLPPLLTEEIDRNDSTQLVQLKLTQNSIVLKGKWRLLGSLSKYVNDSGKTEYVVNSLSGQTLPSKYLSGDMECDHCNTKRDRNAYYIIQNKEDGTTMSIGGVCLKKFFGEEQTAMKNFLKLAKKIENFLSSFRDEIKRKRTGGGSGTDQKKTLQKEFQREGIPIMLFLARALTLVDQNGFVSRKRANEQGTQTTGEQALSSCFNDIDKQIDALYLSKAAVLIEWLNNLEDEFIQAQSNDYLSKLQSIAARGKVKKDDAGLMASAFFAHKRYKETTEEIATDELIGAEGDSIIFRGKVVDISPMFMNVRLSQVSNVKDFLILAQNDKGEQVLFGSNDEMLNDIDDEDLIGLSGKIIGVHKYNENSLAVIDIERFRSYDDFTPEELEAQANKTLNAQQKIKQEQKIVYNHGDVIEKELKLVNARPMRGGSFLMQFEDTFGTKLSGFIKKDFSNLVGQEVHVKGNIKVNKPPFINIDPLEIQIEGVKNETQEIGQRVELDLMFKDIHNVEVLIPNGDYQTVEKIIAEDDSKNTYEFTVPKPLKGVQEFVRPQRDQNSIIKVRGKVGKGYNTTYRLTYPKLLGQEIIENNEEDSFAKQEEDLKDSVDTPDSNQEVKDEAPLENKDITESSSFNWIKHSSAFKK